MRLCTRDICIVFLHELIIYQYELEHEKLATELEEERRSHKERDQWIREQQMKIDNLSSLVTFSDSDRSSSSSQVELQILLLNPFLTFFFLSTISQSSVHYIFSTGVDTFWFSNSHLLMFDSCCRMCTTILFVTYIFCC